MYGWMKKIANQLRIITNPRLNWTNRTLFGFFLVFFFSLFLFRKSDKIVDITIELYGFVRHSRLSNFMVSLTFTYDMNQDNFFFLFFLFSRFYWILIRLWNACMKTIGRTNEAERMKDRRKGKKSVGSSKMMWATIWLSIWRKRVKKLNNFFFIFVLHSNETNEYHSIYIKILGISYFIWSYKTHYWTAPRMKKVERERE